MALILLKKNHEDSIALKSLKRNASHRRRTGTRVRSSGHSRKSCWQARGVEEDMEECRPSEQSNVETTFSAFDSDSKCVYILTKQW